MKFLLLFNGGLNSKSDFVVDQVTYEFMQEIKAEGHDVTVYGQFVDDRLVSKNDNLKEFNFVGLKHKSNKIINYLCLYLYAIKYIIKSDFIYFHYPTAYKYLAIICFLLKKDYAIHIRGTLNLYDKASVFIYKQAKFIITMSDNFTDKVNQLCGKNKAVSLKRALIPYTDKDIVYDRVYKSKDFYNILFLARIVFDKGIIELFQAISKLKKVNKYRFRLNLVGPLNISNDELMKYIKEYDIEDMINIVGPVWDYNKKAQLYLENDVYILPSYHEGFPQTLYEAMVFGTPIITTFVGGISSVMVDKCNCIEIKPRDVDSIVKALIETMENYKALGEYAKNATSLIADIVDCNKPTHAKQMLSYLFNSNVL